MPKEEISVVIQPTRKISFGREGFIPISNGVMERKFPAQEIHNKITPAKGVSFLLDLASQQGIELLSCGAKKSLPKIDITNAHERIEKGQICFFAKKDIGSFKGEISSFMPFPKNKQSQTKRLNNPGRFLTGNRLEKVLWTYESSKFGSRVRNLKSKKNQLIGNISHLFRSKGEKGIQENTLTYHRDV
ncbi:hypothetical protein CEXT_71591 [Caerostris extrusa]|uniref:Uncharacterized protein n=1 Tax=Caerostris extrusa TaxID=172846 RepID=A0AAV4XF56_CAEEX|nr:hypothetical protein CEXT_71591 [Caerostris extrusa]